MLEDFTNGNRELQNRLNELLAVARKVERISGDDHIKVRHTASGINISMERIPKPMGGGVGVKVYKRISDNETAGRYNCYLQTWTEGAWADVNTTEIICDNVIEAAGHAFTGSDFFLALGPGDASGIVPVMPCHYAHAY